MSERQAVSIFFFVNGFVFATWAARLPFIQEYFALDYQGVSYVLLVHSIGAILSMPLSGWLISKYSSRRVVFWSGITQPLCLALIPLMDSVDALVLPFVLLGISTGMMDVSMNAQAVEVEKAYDKPIMTKFHAMFSIGMVAGGLVSSWFVSITTSLSLHFWPIVISMIIVLLITRGFLFNDTTKHKDDEAPHFAFPKRAVVGLGVIAFCCMMSEGAMSDWSTNYMKSIMRTDISIQTFGLISFAALMTIGRLFGDSWRLKLGDMNLLTIGSIMSLLGMLLVVAAIDEISVIIGFSIVGLGLSNIVPIVFSLAGSIPYLKPGMSIAMTSSIGYAGFMVGPPIIGFVSDTFDLRIGLSVLLWLFIIMIVLVLSMRTKRS